MPYYDDIMQEARITQPNPHDYYHEDGTVDFEQFNFDFQKWQSQELTEQFLDRNHQISEAEWNAIPLGVQKIILKMFEDLKNFESKWEDLQYWIEDAPL
jgi:hypothetical protein|tara:strand:- start:677 stop:973 length:297 start_codon:yes stop_codon:yes gene_type:complete